MRIAAYLVGAVTSALGLFVAGLALLLASLVVTSSLSSDWLWGMIIGLIGLGLAALPIVGLLCLRRDRPWLGLGLCLGSLALNLPLMYLIAGGIEAAVRP